MSVPRCGQVLLPRGDTEDSEQIEIEVCAYRRVIHRRRLPADSRALRRGPNIVTASRAQADPERTIRRLGVGRGALWTSIAAYRPTERLCWPRGGWLDFGLGTGHCHRRFAASWRSYLKPIYEALQERNQQGDLHQADETRLGRYSSSWRARRVTAGGYGSRWSHDTVVYLLDPQPRSPHGSRKPLSGRDSRGVLVVDRFSAYKSMSWVKQGIVVLAFCWAHGPAGLSIRVGKGWPQLKTWALEWLRRIPACFTSAERPQVGSTTKGLVAFRRADGRLRKAAAEMKRQMETELAQAKLSRRLAERLWKACKSIGKRIDPIRGRFTDPDGQQRLGTTCARGRRWRGKNFYAAQGRSGAANWRRRHFRPLPRCRSGSLILGNG